MKKLALLALASTIGLTFGCQATTPNPTPSATVKPAALMQDFSSFKKAGGTWTILVHLGAENNLNSFGFSDMNEMASGLTTQNIKNFNVIVLYDGTKSGDSQIFKLKPGGRDPIDDKGAVIPTNTHEIDSGSLAVSQKFIKWAVNAYPSDHLMIDFWDHGAGIFRGQKEDWLPTTKGNGRTSRGFCYDDGGTNMETRDLGPLLASAGRKFDIVSFDACLMGHLEIAYQCKGYADILVASEETEPGDGWDYANWLKKAGTSDLSAASVASTLVDTYKDFYTKAGQDSTLSALDINGIVNNFVPLFNQFGAALEKSLPAGKTAITTARTSTQTFYNSDCADFGDFLKKLGKVSAEVDALVPQVKAAYQKVVIREGHTGSLSGATGMVTYFPSGYASYNSTYDNVKEILFAEQPTWGKFLKALKK